MQSSREEFLHVQVGGVGNDLDDTAHCHVAVGNGVHAWLLLGQLQHELSRLYQSALLHLAGEEVGQ